MTENNKNKPDNSKKIVNSYWLYGIIIFSLLAINLITFVSGKTEQISMGQFKEMAQKGHIEKVSVINKSLVELFIKEDFLKDYPDIDKSKYGVRPHYSFEIGDVRSFDEMVSDLNRKGAVVDPRYESRYNWMAGVMGWLLPLMLIIGLWIFFMRRVGGAGGGPGSQIFNIGKSKATLFDQGSKVNVNFADVAGLEEAKEEVMEVVDFLKSKCSIFLYLRI